MLLKEIPENKLSLSLAVRLHLAFDGNIHHLIQVFGKFFGATSFNSLLDLTDNVCLCQRGSSLKQNQNENYCERITVRLHNNNINDQNYATRER